jgi:ribonuclease R
MRRASSGPRKPGKAITGVLHVARPGSATVETAEGTFLVARGGIREGMNGDTVSVTLSRRGPGDPQAWVQSVVERATTTFLGTFEQAGPLGAVVPLDARISRDFFVLPDDRSPARLGVADHDVVAARILAYPSRHEAGIVTVDRRVGAATELDLDIEAVIASFGLETEFSPATCEQASALELDVDAALASEPARRDLRDMLCVTVDPADARDFDDAVSGRRLPDGGYEVVVHIADVTHYVSWGSPIDLAARSRTCSVYLVDRVLPMLPERLCNDLCSLRPGQDRLCMSVVMRLGPTGEVRSAEACASAIRSDARLDYGTVEQLLEDEIEPSALPCDASRADDVAETLRVLDEVAARRIAVRAARGAIDFESEEAKVTLDADNRPVGVVVRRKTRATSLVEEAMLVANESVATMLAEADVPAAYRVHERPAPEALSQVIPALRELGYAKGGLGESVVAGVPEAIREVLEDAAGTTDEYLVSQLLLRSMKRAVYLPENQGHYALGAKAYCHFTSPIRRYPDDIVHRALKALLSGRLDGPEQHIVAKELPSLCRACSERERVADAASRKSQRVKMAELYLAHVGESFPGIVSGVERYGVFVRLDESSAEGLLPVRAMGEEWFDYDEGRMTLSGESSGRVWRLGQRVDVTVVGCTPSRGHIDFALTGSERG